MSKLTSRKRNHLNSAMFGLPASRKYPMPDRSHAANAKARASQQKAKGHLSAEDYAKICRMADGKLDSDKDGQ